MNLPSFLTSPVFDVLFKWTCLLALGWVADSILRRRHPRWRLILWRSVLCFGLVLPLLQLVAVPGIRIPIVTDDTASNQFADPLSPLKAAKPSQSATPVIPPVKISAATSVSAMGQSSFHPPTPYKPIPWATVITMIWALGCAGGTLRLLRLHWQLSRLQRESCLPTSDLQQLAEQIQIRLKVHRKVEVRISDTVTSPFVCGLLNTVIILPRRLAQELSPRELSALLSHEIAHLRRHDLHWCVAWRWLKVFCWFHPLVWRVPAAHNLACEQEADRVASGQLADQDSYAQLLARLALRVLALPAVETKLTLNGSSQIARRLNHLGQTGVGAWSWKYSVTGFGLAGLLFLLTAGCQFSESTSSNLSPKVEFKTVLVVVQDEAGKPIAGATILPDGFRVKEKGGVDAYGWNKKLFGPPVAATTDGNGRAYVRYPVMGIPEEKELMGKIVFSVSHPEYATVRLQEYSVDSPEQPIQLIRGIYMGVSGYFGSDHQPVKELVPNLNEEVIHPEDWIKNENGGYAFHKLSPGSHLLQLMGRLPSGEIVYSEAFPFTAEKGQEYNFAVEMKPGIRLEGRLDDRVPRPVKNGRVLIDVRPKEYPAWNNYSEVEGLLKKYANFRFWRSYRPIAEDGTFVFESIPPGGLDVIVHGDGFVSKSGGDFEQQSNATLVKVRGFALPQAFSLTAPTTKIEVLTEPAATLELTAKTKSGRPVAGVTVYLNPNVVRMNGILGDMRQSSEAPFRTLPPLPDVPYSATTDKNGVAVIPNVPAITRWLDVYHPQFQAPLRDPTTWRDRSTSMTFSPGVTNRFELTLEPKGEDYIGQK